MKEGAQVSQHKQKQDFALGEQTKQRWSAMDNMSDIDAP
jgi:hypothetical protein